MTTGGRRDSAAASVSGGGQSYLATVSDLISAFIFVFIIMLAFFAYQLATATEEQASVTDELRAADETRALILTAIADRLEQAGIRVDVLLDQGVLRLSENAINFPSGSETPIADHQANVGRVARAIAEVVPCYVAIDSSPDTLRFLNDAVDAGFSGPAYCDLHGEPVAYDCRETRYPWLLETLLIEGHTDDVPVAAGRRFRDNLELSSMRAATVHRMITSCQPGIESMQNSEGYAVLSTSGYGNTRPASVDPERADANRRIDLRFILEPPIRALEAPESEIQVEVRERIGERPH